MDKEILDKIKEYCLKNTEIEMCGLVILQNNICKVVGVTNSHTNPSNNFKLNEIEYALSTDLSDEITAVFHSHINGKGPSFIDKFNCNIHKIKYIIYEIVNDKFYFIHPKDINYLNRKFEIGHNDCYSLVRDYYREELGIKLRNYYRDQSWFVGEKNLFDELFEECGFIKVDDLKENDCILFKINNKIYSNHIGVYLGNNKFLHHPIRNNSEIIELNGLYKNNINYFIRHESFIKF